LPAAWAGQRHWRILETEFGQGLNFLAVWRVWKNDPARPDMLHVAAITARPPAADVFAQAGLSFPGLRELAAELAPQWFGLTRGFHRMAFEGGRVLLTLCVGDVDDMLKACAFEADSVFLDAESGHGAPNPKTVARLCRRGTGIVIQAAPGLRDELAQAGFAVEGGDFLQGTWSPTWELKRSGRPMPAPPGTCVVIGAGLAGASAAASLARRGWRVEVLDAAGTPAAGASGLPAGLLAAYQSPDDNLLSRLSRAGVRMTLRQAEVLLPADSWAACGVLEIRGSDPRSPPENGPHAAWTRRATADELASAGLPDGLHAWWHEKAAWIRPGALVRALLQQPGIGQRFNWRVGQVRQMGRAWAVIRQGGGGAVEADLVIVAAAHAGESLLPRALPLHPVRGQVSWSDDVPEGLPPFPVNGNGHFLPRVTLDTGTAWLCGSSYGRGETERDERADDHQANLARLAALLPAAAAAVRPQFDSRAVQAWTGIRCASSDRRPLAGPIEQGLWVTTAMGSRGLTFAILCAELLAARLHAEPLPLEQRLAAAIGTERISPPA
jgi:tRNA 5-methylaminomethyl-2-thiouridine biosynthesis bifunctional protein